MNLLLFFIDSVEENNELNDASWSDWESAHQIIASCLKNGSVKLNQHQYHQFILDALTALIRDDGDNSDLYIQCLDALEYGCVFHRPRNN